MKAGLLKCRFQFRSPNVQMFCRGGEPGDLYVFIRVKPHPELKREGTTIHSSEYLFVMWCMSVGGWVCG